MFKYLAIPIFALIASCAADGDIVAREFAEFHQKPDGTFVYQNMLAGNLPDNDWGEKARIDELEHILKFRGTCPDGYVISERKVTVTLTVLYDEGNVHYRGRCT